MTSSGTSGRTASWTTTTSSSAPSSAARPLRVLSLRVAPPATTVTGTSSDAASTSSRVSSIQPGWETTTTRSTDEAPSARRVRSRIGSPASRTNCFGISPPNRLPSPPARTIAWICTRRDYVRAPAGDRSAPPRAAPHPPVSSVPSMVEHPPVRRAPTGVPDLELISVGWRRIQVLLRVRPVDAPLDPAGLRLRHATSGATVPVTGWEAEATVHDPPVQRDAGAETRAVRGWPLGARRGRAARRPGAGEALRGRGRGRAVGPGLVHRPRARDDPRGRVGRAAARGRSRSPSSTTRASRPSRTIRRRARSRGPARSASS